MTKIYKRIIEHADWDNKKLTLAHKVWDPTPFIINVYIGTRDDIGIGENENDIIQYCEKNFGKQSWPIHNKPAKWYRAGFTINGWTWFGFKTKKMMKKFIKDWPENTKE